MSLSNFTKIYKPNIHIFKSQKMDAITFTFGDCMENHAGMQKIGKTASKGYSLIDLIKIRIKLNKLNIKSEIINLNNFLPDSEKCKVEGAYLLIAYNYVGDLSSKIIEENNLLPFDKHYYDTRRSKVLNKLARWNLCFDDKGQKADYENKMGTIISYSDVPFTNQLKNMIHKLANDYDLKLEANYYYDLKKTGIGYHGDTERRKVIGVRLGKRNEIAFKWFKNSKHIGTVFRTFLNSGDIYIMSEKAVGFDWKSRSKITLRHAAGAKKYTE
jgi:hypothetical protein